MDVLIVRGRALAATGRYDEAMAAFQPIAQRDPSGEAAFELGRLHLIRGQTAAATRLLERVIAAASRSEVGETIGRAARAAQLLARYEQANTLFRDAAALIGDDPQLQVAWGELFLEKQNRPEAVRSFRAALQSDRRNAAAYAGLARAFADENAAVAKELAGRALGVNPSFVPAHLVVADLALDEDRRADAIEAITQALTVNPQSLDALSLQAAIAMLDDRTADFDALVAKVLAINPSTARSIASPAPRRPVTTASIARSSSRGRPWHSIRRTRAHRPTSARTYCARATKPARVPRSTRPSRPIPTMWSPTTCSACSTVSSRSRPCRTAS